VSDRDSTTVAPALEAAGTESALQVDRTLTKRGERLAGFIYGTIVTLSVVVAGARAFAHEPGHIAVLAFVTTLVLWLAHVYAHAIGHAVGHHSHLSFAGLKSIARRELSIVEASLPSIGALLLGAIGVLDTHAAVWLAIGLGFGVLGAQGIAFARIERLDWRGTVVVFALNLGLGLFILALKLAVTH
jgi:hypothetical protein